MVRCRAHTITSDMLFYLPEASSSLNMWSEVAQGMASVSRAHDAVTVNGVVQYDRTLDT